MTSIKKIGEIDLGDKIILIYITGKYNPKTSQLPNHMPSDTSRYMHRHRYDEIKKKKTKYIENFISNSETADIIKLVGYKWLI